MTFPHGVSGAHNNCNVSFGKPLCSPLCPSMDRDEGIWRGQQEMCVPSACCPQSGVLLHIVSFLSVETSVSRSHKVLREYLSS